MNNNKNISSLLIDDNYNSTLYSHILIIIIIKAIMTSKLTITIVKISYF